MTPYTRREFTKFALAALPTAGLLLNSAHAAAAAKAGKVNSKVNGVQIGLNVPYSFGNMAMTGDEVLAACVELGVNGLELRTQPVEVFLGVPPELVARNRAAPNPANVAALKEWRAGAKVARAAEFRKKYEAAGLLIEIVKVDGIFRMTDAELDYVFSLGKTLGARALSSEISSNEDDHQRIGRFADKHQLMIGLHGHGRTGPDHWEKAIAHAKHIGINLDLGHYVAGNNASPIEYMKQRHDRITHVHVKDRKLNEGATTPFGQGDTPVVEALRLIRDQKWPIQATIEFEYPVPAGSTRMAEIAKCIKYCRDALA